MIFITFSILLVTIVIYKLIVEPMCYWDQRGIKHPGWLTFTHINWLAAFQKRSIAFSVQELYNCVPGTRYHGFHQMNLPVVVLKDPDLIKQIGIKAFDHFTDRRFTFADPNEPLLGKNLLNLKGQKWRDMRNYLSPSFTTNKMKMLFRIMDNSGKKFIRYFFEKQEDMIEIDMKDAFTRYTNDVIASCVFGVEIDSLKDLNNEFYLRGKEATDVTRPFFILKIMCAFLTPKLYKILGLQLLPKTTTDFFTKLIRDNIKLREEGKIVQTDVIHLLLEAKKELEAQEKTEHTQKTEASITTEDIMSQAIIFFFAGFESVSRTMCFMAYELAVNRDVQQKLRAEIQEITNNYNEQITYDLLMRMKYMDMVVSEVLRKYPIQAATDRICTRSYILETNTEEDKPIHIDVGTAITIPTYALHHDPQFFTDPEKFDPERFSKENKSNIRPYAYQPFGIGPRVCIGSRFALMETKLIYFHLLSKFDILPVEKTKIPLVFLKNSMTLSSEFGFWFGLKRL